MTENREFVKGQYSWQAADGKASTCTQCGACEDMCPQGIKIIDLIISPLLEMIGFIGF